jgi:hypothetical protein
MSVDPLPPLPPLSRGQLETLLAALDPLLDGFGCGSCDLDDARAYLRRLGEDGAGEPLEPILVWLDRWGEAGGNRRTLHVMVSTLMWFGPPTVMESVGGPVGGTSGSGSVSPGPPDPF